MLTPGTVLQRGYRIERSLGQGGMGTVYLACHVTLNKWVALKECSSTNLTDATRFEREAKLLASLSHPNLPQVSDFFTEQSGVVYIVMDYIQGQNLFDYVQTHGVLPEEQMLSWMRQIFNAIEYLHQNQVIHRDIKPHNILITPQGKAVLVDFGIAKAMTQPQGTSIPLGTPGYAPLEQHGKTGIDARTDVYALGATMYFLLTGMEPLDSPTRAAGRELPAPRASNPAISQYMENVILSAMNLQPAYRYESVAAMARAMASRSQPQVFASPVQSSPSLPPQVGRVSPQPVLTQYVSAPPYPPQPVPNTWKWLFGTVAVVAALLVIVAVIYGLISNSCGTRSDPKPGLCQIVLIAPKPSTTPTPTLTPIRTGEPTASRTTPPPPTSPPSAATAMPPPTSAPVVTVVTSTPVTATSTPRPTPSPTVGKGQQKLEVESNSVLNVVDLAINSKTRVFKSPGSIYSAAWSKEGQRILISHSTGAGSAIVIVDANGQNPVVIAQVSGDYDIAPRAYRQAIWSPNEQRIAFAHRETNRNACPWIMNEDGGARQPLPYCEAADNPRFWSVDGTRVITWSSNGLTLAAYDLQANRRIALQDLGKVAVYDQRYFPWKITDQPTCTEPEYWYCQ